VVTVNEHRVSQNPACLGHQPLPARAEAPPRQVVTVNDYLARRDSEWVGQVHRFLGLSVGLVQTGLTEDARKAAYAADVTYVTNSELGFDFLRDNLAQARAPSAGGGPPSRQRASGVAAEAGLWLHGALSWGRRRRNHVRSCQSYPARVVAARVPPCNPRP